MKGEQNKLKHKVAQLTEQVDRLSRVGEVPPLPFAHEASASIKVESEKSEESSTEDWSSSEDRGVVSSATRKSLPSERKLTKAANRSSPHPRGFKEIRGHVQPFSGKEGDNDFQMWLDDFHEVSADCGWSDKTRARWFSSFIVGPAKATRQRTLQSEDKACWEKIVEVKRGQYGVHLDSRTAYQRYHELSYEQFGRIVGCHLGLPANGPTQTV